jgi:hypothetical protein
MLSKEAENTHFIVFGSNSQSAALKAVSDYHAITTNETTIVTCTNLSSLELVFIFFLLT